MTDRITPALQWLETRLDEGAWVRRIYLVLATLLSWKTTLWAFNFADTSSRPGMDVAAIIGAVAAVPGAITGFAFKYYTDSRGPQ